MSTFNPRGCLASVAVLAGVEPVTRSYAVASATAAAAFTGMLLLAPVRQAEAGKTEPGAKAALGSEVTTVVRDHRGDGRQLRQPSRTCYRNHTHLPDGSCVSAWSQTPGAIIAMGNRSDSGDSRKSTQPALAQQGRRTMVTVAATADRSDPGIHEAAGRIDYDACGAGPTLVLVPGSCSTGAAWRPVMAALNGRFRCVTTSLLGYGGTAERRSAHDPSIAHEADIVEAVIGRAGGRVHLVGHSFGGLVALAVALRNRVRLESLIILEAPAVEALREAGEHRHYRAFRDMSDAYFAAFRGGDGQAIAAMVDFYGGGGTFASWPPKVRAYAVETTRVNMLDWASAYGFGLSRSALAAVTVPTLVLRGGASHPAVQRANELLSIQIAKASLVTVAGAGHFMISTHAEAVAHAITRHLALIEPWPSRSDATGSPTPEPTPALTFGAHGQVSGHGADWASAPPSRYAGRAIALQDQPLNGDRT